MSRGYWRVILAAFGGLILIAAGIGYGLHRQAGYADDQYYQSANYAEHAAHQVTNACLRLPSSEQSNCFNEGADKYRLDSRDKQREYADLAAQQTSALWTMIMGVAALIGMALSALGVALVWLTFAEQKAANVIARTEAMEAARESAKALEVAERNAETAAEQIRLSEKISRTTLRAYVTPAAAKIVAFAPEKGELITHWEITVPWYNGGQTPALNGRQILESDPAAGRHVKKDSMELADAVIGTRLSFEGLPRQISKATLQAIFDGRYKLTIIFRFLYADIYTIGEADSQSRESAVAFRVECGRNPVDARKPNEDHIRLVYVEGSSVQT